MRRMTTPAAVIVDAAAYAQAVEDAVRAAAAYYEGGTSALDDDAYDRLVRGIADWEAEHPDGILPDYPTGKVAGGAVEGEVLSVDRYGNTQLSITAADVTSLGARPGGTLMVWLGRRQITVPFRESFASVPPGELVAFADSAGLIALAVNYGDAAQRLGLPPGAHVRLAPAA